MRGGVRSLFNDGSGEEEKEWERTITQAVNVCPVGQQMFVL